MIDIHCHILPEMDDGPASLDEALAMCRIAAGDGIRTIVAAPHFRPGTYEFSGSRLLGAISSLQAAIKKEGMDLTILPGAEITVSPEMLAYLKSGKLLTINGGRYFLAEFSPLSVPGPWKSFLLSFLVSGMAPIIAHPERNAWFVNHPDALASAIQSGILVQITAASITGGFGEEARDFCIYLLRHNFVHAIASDGHSTNLRPPLLAEAVSLAAEVVGWNRAMALVTSLPRAIIENGKIPALPPVGTYPPIWEQNRNWFHKLRHLGSSQKSW